MFIPDFFLEVMVGFICEGQNPDPDPVLLRLDPQP